MTNTEEASADRASGQVQGGQLSRRGLLAFAGVAAAGAMLADAGGAFGAAPASAAVAWNHPFASVRGTITSPYGYRYHPISGQYLLHAGTDYSPPRAGTPVHAVAAGTVAQVNVASGGYGTHVIINHADGYQSLYGHLQASSARVTAGQRIGAGTVVGLLGNTGSSTAAHLHMELRRNGTSFDAAPLLHNAPLAGNPGTPAAPEDDEEDDMIRLTHCPNESGSGPDEYIVIDHGQHTFWGVPNTSMLALLRAQGIKEITDRQGRQIIAGYRRIA